MTLSNVQIVLVEPIYPGNVGAVARSAKNYGAGGIRIVGNLDIQDLEAKKNGAVRIRPSAAEHST